MKIAILGIGTVGSGVYELLHNPKFKCLKKIEVVKVLVRPGKEDDYEEATSKINDILDDPSIDCIIETMGGLHPAYEYICTALNNKKHVVTANKAVAAKYLPEFLALAEENHVTFLFEASVGGGIPWLINLNQIKQTNTIKSFRGIFNGTSNFILDRMSRFQESFESALAIATDLGYAEADPSADIDGYDIQNKVALSNAVAFESYTSIETIPTFPLRGIQKNDIDYAASIDCQIKYIGSTSISNERYASLVIPTVVSKQSLEANVLENNNIASLDGSTVGTLSFFGQGAGKLPTANAIVQDLLMIQQNNCLTKTTIQNQLQADETEKHRFLIRTPAAINDSLISKTETYQTGQYNHTKALNLQELSKLLEKNTSDECFVMKIENKE